MSLLRRPAKDLIQKFYTITRRHNSTGVERGLNKDFLVVSDRVKDALATNKALVALESTIITHGLPWPNNYEIAIELESIIESENAVPATIGFLNGKLKVGLDRREIEVLAKPNKDAVKLSRRDLSYAFSQAANKNNSIIGGTTVATTMIASQAAQIPIFVTGGIGGVHRDFNESLDVSADLFELGQTNVTVISSGVKSILDIGKTLEYLETLGVCVCTLSETGSTEFPAFFTSKSGFNAPYNLKSIQDAANLVNTHMKTGLQSGILIGVPIPEKHSIDHNLIENSISNALKLAKQQDIKGKHVTPFLLAQLNKITHGTSLKSNLELIKNNARIGAQISRQLSEIRSSTLPKVQSENAETDHRVTLIGGINIDFSYKLKDDKTLAIKGVTQPSEFNQYLGGVARNMSESLLHFGVANVNLLSALSNDFTGEYVIDKSKQLGFDTTKWLILDSTKNSTGTYCALFDPKGELLSGFGAMEAHEHISPEYLSQHDKTLLESSICVIDADVPCKTISYISKKCFDNQIPLWYNPTDLRKCTRIIESNSLQHATYLSPNTTELFTMFKHLFKNGYQTGDKLTKLEVDKLGQIVQTHENSHEKLTIADKKLILKYMLVHVPFIVLTNGGSDLMLASAWQITNLHDKHQLPLKSTHRNVNHEWSPQVIYFPVVELDQNECLVNVSGAGDSTSSGIIAGLLKGYNLVNTVYNGLLAAKYALLTHKNVSECVSGITRQELNKCVQKYEKSIRIEKL